MAPSIGSATDEVRVLREQEEQVRVKLIAVEQGIASFARRHSKGFLVKELVEATGGSLPGRNNTLLRLYESGLVERERVVPPSGGKQYRYLPTRSLLNEGRV